MFLNKMRSVDRVREWGLGIGVVAFLLGPSLFAESAPSVGFSTEAIARILEISSQSFQTNEMRVAKLFGDGRLEVSDFDLRDLNHAKRQFYWQLDPEALEAVEDEIATAELHLFTEAVGKAKEGATGRPMPSVDDAGPVRFKISWLELGPGNDKTERITNFALSYGGTESKIYPEIKEYAAAQRLIMRLLLVSDTECRGCQQ
jgi:hypothetical protein